MFCKVLWKYSGVLISGYKPKLKWENNNSPALTALRLQALLETPHGLRGYRSGDRGIRMSAVKVRKYLEERGLEDRITTHTETIDTVEHAAQQIGCSEAEIAKTLSFLVDEKPVIVVMAGDTRVNSSKFKAQFHEKPHMIPREDVERITGDLPGGVCPFAIPAGIPIWLDISLKRFETVHPAGGDEFTSVAITPTELAKASGAIGWCDVCKGWLPD